MARRPPIIVGSIRPRHLTSGSLRTLWRGAVRRGAIRGSTSEALLWWSAAHAARRRDDPCAAWLAIVTSCDWRALRDDDEAAGRRDLLALAGRLPAERAADTGPASTPTSLSELVSRFRHTSLAGDRTGP